MFEKPTVFVLGAGASWHYGYPTGEGLVEAVISMADRLSKHCERRTKVELFQLVPDYVQQRMNVAIGTPGGIAGWETVRDECQLLIDRLRSIRPLLIDYFLGWNEELRPIGKLMIAGAILECEARWLVKRANYNRHLLRINDTLKPTADEIRRLDITKYNDDWHRFIVHKLLYGCTKSSDLLMNDVHFITFNYDTSLEYQLYKSLTAIDLLEKPHIDKFLGEGDRIVHVYGAVHETIPTEKDAIDLALFDRLGSDISPVGAKELLDKCLRASNNLKTVDPHDKEVNKPSLNRAREWLKNPAVIYVLGFGFDPENSRRIGLDTSLRRPKKAVMFTNYRKIATVSKRASSMIFGIINGFGDVTIHGAPGSNYTEMSERTVYDAIADDFDALQWTQS